MSWRKGQACGHVLRNRVLSTPGVLCEVAQRFGVSHFVARTEQFLEPELRPGDIVVMDKLALHQVAGVKAASERAGATVKYLPPYSVEYDPVDQVFAKLKAMLQKNLARTVKALWSAIGSLL